MDCWGEMVTWNIVGHLQTILCIALHTRSNPTDRIESYHLSPCPLTKGRHQNSSVNAAEGH